MHTRSPDVNNSTVVRVTSLGVGDGRGTDGNDGGLISRVGKVSVRIIITRRDDSGNTGGDEVVKGLDRSVEASANPQESNGRATSGFSMIGNPFNSGNAVWNVGVSTKNGLLIK